MRTSLTRATFVLLLAVVAIAWSHSPSHAITYTYTGVCTTECAEVGLTAGDAVSGTIAFLDAALVPGSPYPAPSSFSLQFGSVVITDATADSFGLFAVPLPPFPALPTPAIVPADLTSFVAELHVGEDPIAPATAADGLLIAPSGQWIGTADGNCNDTECHFLFTRGDPAQGSGAWSVAAVAVPMPATLSVLAIAMLGTAWLTRAPGRRASSSHRPVGSRYYGPNTERTARPSRPVPRAEHAPALPSGPELWCGSALARQALWRAHSGSTDRNGEALPELVGVNNHSQRFFEAVYRLSSENGSHELLTSWRSKKQPMNFATTIIEGTAHAADQFVMDWNEDCRGIKRCRD